MKRTGEEPAYPAGRLGAQVMALTTKRKTPKAQPRPRAKKKALASEQGLTTKHHALLTLTPTVSAACIAQRFSIIPRTEGDECSTIGELVAELRDKCEKVHSGDLERAESMLISQAHSLDVMFAHLALRAENQEFLPQYEAHMKLALKAQNQCRMTLETLATIKNPPVVFAKQANIAHGHQQVNNGEAAPLARAEENEKSQTKLLEASHAKPEWMDAGAARAAVSNDSAVATMGTLDRPADD